MKALSDLASDLPAGERQGVCTCMRKNLAKRQQVRVLAYCSVFSLMGYDDAQHKSMHMNHILQPAFGADDGLTDDQSIVYYIQLILSLIICVGK